MGNSSVLRNKPQKLNNIVPDCWIYHITDVSIDLIDRLLFNSTQRRIYPVITGPSRGTVEMYIYIPVWAHAIRSLF